MIQLLESRIPPPFVTIAAAGIMWLAARLWPSLTLQNPAPYWPSFGLLVIGVLVSFAGVREFRLHGSTVDPRNPNDATALVTTGIYRYTRNPMYLGIVIALCGMAWYLSTPLALVGIGAFVLYITFFQIRAEERALICKFGASCSDYMRHVRRWL